MNSSGSTTTSLFNGSGSNKFGENNNKYENLPVSSENALIKQKKQQFQQQQQQSQQQQYQQQGFIDSSGLSSGGITQLRRTQSIISQNLRDQQYQLYCSGNSSTLLQQQQPSQQQQYGEPVVTQLQQQNINNSYGSIGDAGLYGNSGPGGGPTNLVRQGQQKQAGVVSQQHQQQYSTSFTGNNSLPTETNYLSTSSSNNTTVLKQFYNKRDSDGFDSSAGSDTRFNCQPQTYQQQQEVLYQPYQPEYATYQSQQQQPQQQILYNQSQQHQQPNQLQQQQQQQQCQQNQNLQYPQNQQQQYQRQNQDQKQPQLGDHQQQYGVEQQQRVDNNYAQNATTLTHGSGLVSSGGTKFSENMTGLEPSSTAFRPLQQQGQVSNVIYNLIICRYITI